MIKTAMSSGVRFLRMGWVLVAAAGGTALWSQTVVSGTYSAATIPGDIVVIASTSATFTNGTTFTGANATFNNSSGIYWQQVGTLSGKTLTMASGSYLYVTGVGNALTLDAATTTTGTVSIYTDGSAGTSITNQGTVNHTSGSGSIYSLNFTNSGGITATGGSTLYLGYPSAGYNSTNTGTVTADGAGTTVYLRGNFDNNGTLTAQNAGILRFDGASTTANLGTVVLASGGRVQLNGTLDNTAATLTAPTGGTYELYGGTITGGTIATGALTFTTSSGTLNGATLLGDLNLLSTSVYVYFAGGATFTGANANFAGSTSLYWQQAGTLSGKTLTMASGSYIYVNGTGNALTLDAATTATGTVTIYTDGSAGTSITNQGTVNHTSGSGSIYSLNFTNSGGITATGGSTLYLGYPSAGYNSTNTGTVTADGAGTTVYLRGNFDNNSTLTAQNAGILRFDGANTTANLGTVVLATGGRAQLNGTLDNTATTLTAPTGGTYELYGGTITGGTIATGALTFTTSFGTLSGVTLLGDLNLPSTSVYVAFAGGTTFTGTNANFTGSTGVYWQQAGTLSGKALTMANGAYIYVSGVGNALTLDAATTATGSLTFYTDGSAGTSITNLGTLNHTGSSGSIYSLNFTNSGGITATGGGTLYLGYPAAGYNSTNTGTVVVDGSGTTVYLRGNFDNNGTLTAQNSGILRFDGASTTANLGNVVLATGGRAQLNGTLDNSAATLTAPTGGTYELYGGTITGGTIAAGALTFTTSSGTLNGVTLLGDLNLLATSAYTYFAGGSNFTGTNANFAASTGLYWQQVGTLSGKNLTMAAGAYIYVTGVGNTLTLDAATTATGTMTMYTDGNAGTSITNLGTLNHTASTGSIYALNFTNSGGITATSGNLYLGYPSAGYNSTNTGTVVANGSGTTVYLRGNFDNNGTMTAQNSGVLMFNGSNTTANLGNVVLATGGRALLNGALDNTAATLNTIIGGNFELYGGTVSGGTIATGALTFTTSGGTLNNVSLLGDLNLATAGNYAYFSGGTTFTGANATLAGSAGIYWQQAGTLAGKALTFANGAYLYVTGTNNTLTLDAATTLTGDANLYSDGSVGTVITNLGNITHNVGSGNLYARDFTNSGTISATAGTLFLGYNSAGYTFNNTAAGTIVANGGTVYVNAPLTNAGMVNVQSGTLYTGTNLTNGATGVIQGSGTINGSLVMNGGTLAPGNSVGTLTFQSSNFSVTNAAILSIEISGATSDKVSFLSPLSNVDIGSGLLTLSLSLLSAPTPGTTYTIMQITGGANVFTGSFVGMPNNGDGTIAMFGAQQYLFTVNYLSNGITLNFTPVPEPATGALLGAGLAVLALGAARRRRIG